MDSQYFFQKTDIEQHIEHLKKEFEKKAKEEMKAYDDTYKMRNAEKLILATIIQNPGLSNNEVADLSYKSPTNLSNILRRLREHNLVLFIKIDKTIYNNPNYKFIKDNPNFLEEIEEKFIEDFDEKTKQKIDFYDNIYKMTKIEKLILAAIIQKPGLSNIELANYLHKSPSSLSRKIKILKDYNLVLFYQVGKKMNYYANENLIKHDEMKNIDKVTDENVFPFNRKVKN